MAISPDLSLLEQISAHLQEGGRFQVFGMASGKEALKLAAKQSFDLVILDAETNDLPFVPLTRELVALLPNFKLLVYPPQNNPHHPVMSGVIANGFLNKPFFGPEVNERISRALNGDEPLPESSDEGKNLARLWVEHPESGQHQIEQLLASTSASAGILLMHGQVIAASGALADVTSQNVINFLTRYWSNIQSGELFRYLKMDSEAKTYLVYATPLFTEVAFALIYHTNLSLFEIRKEVALIRKAFLNHYTNTSQLRMEFSTITRGDEMPLNQSPVTNLDQVNPVQSLNANDQEESPAVEREPELATQDFVPKPTTDLFDQWVDSEEPESESANGENQSGLSEQELANIDALLAEMPVPDPENNLTPESSPIPVPTPAGEWLPQQTLEMGSALSEESHESFQPSTGVTQPLHPISRPTQPASKTEPLLPRSDKTQAHHSEEFLDFNFKLPWEEEGQNSNSQTLNISLTPPPLPVLEPLPARETPSAIYFKYQLLLLPYNPEQFITHELANLLNQQLSRLHQSSGWQCVSLTIRPLYMQWTAILPANTCLNEMVQEIKERTTIQIFANFPGLLQTHLNGEFWAPGYFSISGSQSLSTRLINDYISLSRQILTPKTSG